MITVRPQVRHAVLAAAALATADASAQLSAVEGITEIQRIVAENIQLVCANFNPASRLFIRSPQNPEELKLFDSCRKMVHTGNALTNQIPTERSLGLDAAATNTATQAIGNEEFSSVGRRAVEVRARNGISGRLLALRAGARGLALSGTTRDEAGRAISLAGLAPGTRGGGAAADTGNRWGGFVNVNFVDGDRGATDREDAFDFKNVGVTAGADYRINDALAIGGALSWDDSDSDFDNSLGSVDSKAWGFTLYGTYSMGDFYLDGNLSYSKIDLDTVRRIEVATNTNQAGFLTAASASPEGDQFAASFGVGYQMKLGQAILSPYGRLEYLRLETDGFTESEPLSGLALQVQGQTVKSFQSAFGARIHAPFSTGWGVVTPYAGVEWNHEFDNDQRGVAAKYLNDPFTNGFVIPTDSPDRNFFTWSFGASAQFARGVSGFVNLDTVSGLEHTDYYGITVGVRVEF